MSFFSAADIVKAAQMGHWIYKNWFVRSNQADLRYLEFLKDVRQLSLHLERLGEVFDKAEGGMREGLPVQSKVIQSRRVQSRELIGDFAATLDECKKLLVENQKYSRPGNNPANTARWWISGLEGESQALRTKVQFHCTKISFIVEPLQLELLQKISEDVQVVQQQLRALMQRLDGSAASEPPPVPVELAERYAMAALSDRPFQSNEEYPLKETINALLFNFSQSTVNASSYQQPTAEQFNALLKARWILEKVLPHPHYKRLGPCLHRAVVTSVNEKIELEYNRFEDGWESMELGSMLTLEDSHFTVWFEENPRALSPSATDEDFGEMKILSLPLQAGPNEAEQNIMVFRQSETEFRLLRATFGEAAVKQVLNTHTFRCVPLYAVPDEAGATNSLSICHNSVNRPEVFEMESREDVMALQQAFTNYRVTNNSPTVQWTLTRGGILHKPLKGLGRSGVQIWHPETLGRAGDPVIALESAVSDGSSRRSSTLAEDLMGRLGTRPGSLMSVPQASSASVIASDGVIASLRPKTPALMLFTQLATRHGGAAPAFVYVPMEPGFHINKYGCGCAAPSSSCRDLVLELNPRRRSKFRAKIHRALDGRNQPNLQDWNLFVFADPKPAAYDALETVDDAVELHLRFGTVDDRKRFAIALCRTLDAAVQATADFNKVRSQMRVLEHRLHRADSGPGRAGSISDALPSPLLLPSPFLQDTPRQHRASTSSTLSVPPAPSSVASSPPARAPGPFLSASPQLNASLSPQASRSTLGSFSGFAGPDAPPADAPSPTRARTSAAPGPPPTQPRAIPSRASSKTMVGSPAASDAEGSFYWPGTRATTAAAAAAAGLGRIADEDEDEGEPVSAQSTWLPQHVKRLRADSGASLSPLSASPDGYAAPRRGAGRAAVATSPPPLPRPRKMYQELPADEAPRHLYQEMPADEAPPRYELAAPDPVPAPEPAGLAQSRRRVATWMKLVPDPSELTRALRKQAELEGGDRDALGIRGVV